MSTRASPTRSRSRAWTSSSRSSATGAGPSRSFRPPRPSEPQEILHRLLDKDGGVAQRPATSRNATSRASNLSDTNRVKVLVVDDEPAVRAALERALRSNYEVRLAPDGQTALDAVAERPVDAVVLDVAMPGLGGLEGGRGRRRGGGRRPVLILTARDAVDDRVAGLDAGADDSLVKPFALRE